MAIIIIPPAGGGGGTPSGNYGNNLQVSGALLNLRNDGTVLSTVTLPSGGTETDPLSIHLDQTSPQTMSGGAFAGSGLVKLTGGKLGVDTTTYATTAQLSGYVPTTTTVNGHQLSGNISVTQTDVGLGFVDNAHQQRYHGVLSRATNPLPTKLTNSTFTLNTSTYPMTYYYLGEEVLVNTNKTVTIGSEGTGIYWVHFDGNTGNLLATQAFPGFTNTSKVIIASVTWNGSYGIVNDERHGYNRNTSWHSWAHVTVGTRYYTNGGLNLTVNGANATSTLALTAGRIYDEDIQFDIGDSSTWSTPNSCRQLWQTGAFTYTFDTTARTTPFKLGANNRPVVVNATTYALTELSSGNGHYCNVFFYATTDLDIPLYCVVETMPASTISANGWSNLANARAVPFPNLNGANITPELRPLFRVIIDTNGTVQAITGADDYRTVTSLPQAAGTATQIASSVSFAPYGDIAGTNVQLAIEELDAEKANDLSFTANTGVLKGAALGTPIGTGVTIASMPNQNGGNALKFWSGTQALYDAIGTKDPDTLYFIV